MILRKSCAYARRRESDMKYHETEICHGGRLGCWVRDDRAVRWGRCILEGLAFAVLIVGLCAVCAVA